jgi:hypothetical protein
LRLGPRSAEPQSFQLPAHGRHECPPSSFGGPESCSYRVILAEIFRNAAKTSFFSIGKY